MNQQFGKRLLSMVLCLALLMNSCPVVSFAVEDTGLCDHHPVHDGCAYREAVEGMPCTHEHDESCYAEVTQCTHVHGDCGYVAAVPGTDCGHSHDDPGGGPGPGPP